MGMSRRDCIAVMVMGLTSWLAQSAGAQAAAPAGNTQAYTTTPPAASNSAADPAPPIGAVVQHNGGSLARAQLGAGTLAGSQQGAGPAGAAASFSYFAVPEQQPKLLRKHDLVTIVIREDSAFSTDATTDLKHSADFDAQIDDYVTLMSGLGLESHTPTNPIELKTLAARDFNGQGTVNRTDSFTASITAAVVDVKPNGTLVLEAKKTIKTDEELQDIQLVGTCRVQDITADNSVLSTQLYDLKVTKNHKGAVRDTTKRGFIPRVLDWINPF
jgi:flagellar L-ring protein precursor FlgH